MGVDHDHEPDVDTRPEIAASWARSSRSGVDESHLDPRLAPGTDPRGRLASLAAPVLDRLATTLADTRATVVLTDARAGVLDRRAGTSDLHGLLDDVGLVPGYSYAEDAVGTNGMGTAAEERRIVQVRGDEHYAERLRGLTCVGVPIEHPVTGRLEGVLDLTCFNDDAGPWMAPLLTEAVAGVQGRLEEQATVAERALFGAFLKAAHRAAGAVVSINESFVLTNPAAARLLDGLDRASLWEVGAEAVAGGRTFVRDLQVAGGELVRARFDVVSVSDRPVGAVVHLDEIDLDRPSGRDGTRAARRRSTPPSTSTTSTSASADPPSSSGAGEAGRSDGPVARSVAEVRGALEAGERVLVHGPPGAGKTSLARAALGVGVAEATVLDAARVVADGARAWLTAVDVALGAGPVVIRHLDVLTAEAAAGLAAVLDDAAAGHPVVATLTDVPSAAASVPVQALVDRFGRLVRVPGLTERTAELPGLVRSIVGRLVPSGAVNVAPEVVQALARVEWTGNLRQLEAVLHRVLVRRRTGTVTLDDLPPEVRASTHRPHLTTMEQRECEAIAEALAAHDGNKVAAAASLGISRSTLYRKLDAYGLNLDLRTY
jgi:transcriptional regulator of acetoin/glycerol metabolism